MASLPAGKALQQQKYACVGFVRNGAPGQYLASGNLGAVVVSYGTYEWGETWSAGTRYSNQHKAYTFVRNV